jgi:hypothetical protein
MCYLYANNDHGNLIDLRTFTFIRVKPTINRYTLLTTFPLIFKSARKVVCVLVKGKRAARGEIAGHVDYLPTCNIAISSMQK